MSQLRQLSVYNFTISKGQNYECLFLEKLEFHYGKEPNIFVGNSKLFMTFIELFFIYFASRKFLDDRNTLFYNKYLYYTRVQGCKKDLIFLNNQWMFFTTQNRYSFFWQVFGQDKIV